MRRISSLSPYFLAAIFTLFSCTPEIALFNETAYQQAVDLKVEAMELIPKATDSFEEYEKEVTELRRGMAVAYEFAHGRPDNEISTRQWEIMKDPERNMLGGFLARWEDEGTLSGVFVEEMLTQIEEGFDTIIGLESGKIDPDEV